MTALLAVGGILTTLAATAAIALHRADHTACQWAQLTGDNDDN